MLTSTQAVVVLALWLIALALALAALVVLLKREAIAAAFECLGRLMCRHTFSLVQEPERLYLRCSQCGRETKGIAVPRAPHDGGLA